MKYSNISEHTIRPTKILDIIFDIYVPSKTKTHCEHIIF